MKSGLTTFKKPLRLQVKAYYVRSIFADGKIIGFGECKKGEWVRVPERVYQDISNAIGAGASDWKVKTEMMDLEA
jgi:hypothetical protein